MSSVSTHGKAEINKYKAGQLLIPANNVTIDQLSFQFSHSLLSQKANYIHFLFEKVFNYIQQ